MVDGPALAVSPYVVRWATGVGATAALLLSALTACGSGATDKAPSITAPEVFYLRPVGDRSGPKDKAPFGMSADDGKVHTGGTGAVDHTLTADVLPGAKAAVVLHRSGNCTGSSTHVTCQVGAKYDSASGAGSVSPVAAEGSKPGDAGTVRFTYADRNGKKVTARTRAVVGEPVVEVLTAEAVGGVRPGAALSEPVVVRNTGEVPVSGLGPQVGLEQLEFEKRYANCRYPGIHRGHTAVCEFPDLRIAPGATVTLRPALRLRTDETEMYASFNSEAWALDMGQGQYGSHPAGGDHGDGPALRAETVTAKKGTYAKGGGWTHVVLDTHADYSVSDVDLHGAPGTRRTFKLTVRNNGPADAGATEQLVFSPAPGMTMVKQPMSEIDEDVHEPYCEHRGATYTCDLDALKPGRTQDFTFTMLLGEPGAGTLTLRDKAPVGGWYAGGWYVGDRDPDPANDEAVITVHPER
ncbi:MULTISPECIES: hypothetical protein [unclassified Streptomyces]|uniref:hypothetical protein n=1 Tax=unclassified Streptomyces TaxID=2593676 RepID=UPI002E2CFFD5|nr:hypothetical protein [Streptomyces sp. NBC_00228]